MKFILHFTIAMILAFSSFNVAAQQVIASAGGTFENQDISISFTIGEPVIETFTNGNIILTQGFQQPYSFYLQQILNIPAGWSGVSTYIDPLNKDVSGIFSTAQSELIILASMAGVYYPTEGINTIGNWNYLNGYNLKAESDFQLTVTGSKIPSLELEINEGWNLIPVLSSCEADVENLFSGISGFQMIKQVAGPHLYWPAFGINTLETLKPGKAYYAATEEEGTIIFPECVKSSTVSHNRKIYENTTSWNEPGYSSVSHVVAFPAKVFENSGIKPDDVIGAFTMDGNCAGRLEVQNSHENFALTIFGDDMLTPEKDGFDYAEPFLFKVYRPETDEVFDITVNFDPTLPQTGYFTDHGLSAVQSLKVQSTGILDFSTISMEVYPNPSRGIFNVRVNKTLENPELQINDFRGSLIKEIHSGIYKTGENLQFDLSDLPNGVYFLTVMDEGFVAQEKIIIHK